MALQRRPDRSIIHFGLLEKRTRPRAVEPAIVSPTAHNLARSPSAKPFNVGKTRLIPTDECAFARMLPRERGGMFSHHRPAPDRAIQYSKAPVMNAKAPECRIIRFRG
jgi:hypothetical protein